MTQLVTDNKTWRRHTDPPGLWVIVMMGSVVLHLLLFWLIRSSEFARSQQQSSDAVPIEFIETTPKARAKTRPHSTAKLVSPNRQSTHRQSVSTRLPKRVTQQSFTAKTSSSTKDSNTIAFPNTKEPSALYSKTQVVPEKPLKKLTGVQKTVLPKTKSRIKPEPLKPEPTREIADNTEQNFTRSPDTHFSNNSRPTLPPINSVSKDLSRSDDQDLAPRPPNTPESTSSRQRNLSSGDTKVGSETPLSQGGGIALATLTVEPGGIKHDIPDNPARVKPSQAQILWKCPALETESNSKLPNFRVYFHINNKLGKVDWVKIYPDDLANLSLEQQKQYTKCADDNLLGRELFTQATNKGIAPPGTEQSLRIIIKQHP